MSIIITICLNIDRKKSVSMYVYNYYYLLDRKKVLEKTIF
jgi:hypothetical protein